MERLNGMVSVAPPPLPPGPPPPLPPRPVPPPPQASPGTVNSAKNVWEATYQKREKENCRELEKRQQELQQQATLWAARQQSQGFGIPSPYNIAGSSVWNSYPSGAGGPVMPTVSGLTPAISGVVQQQAQQMMMQQQYTQLQGSPHPQPFQYHSPQQQQLRPQQLRPQQPHPQQLSLQQLSPQQSGSQQQQQLYGQSVQQQYQYKRNASQERFTSPLQNQGWNIGTDTPTSTKPSSKPTLVSRWNIKPGGKANAIRFQLGQKVNGISKTQKPDQPKSESETAPSKRASSPKQLPSKRADGLPKPLADWVGKNFAAASTQKEKDGTEGLLRQRIEEAFRNGTAYTHDWTKEPLIRYKTGKVNVHESWTRSRVGGSRDPPNANLEPLGGGRGRGTKRGRGSGQTWSRVGISRWGDVNKSRRTRSHVRSPSASSSSSSTPPPTHSSRRQSFHRRSDRSDRSSSPDEKRSRRAAPTKRYQRWSSGNSSDEEINRSGVTSRLTSTVSTVRNNVDQKGDATSDLRLKFKQNKFNVNQKKMNKKKKNKFSAGQQLLSSDPNHASKMAKRRARFGKELTDKSMPTDFIHSAQVKSRISYNTPIDLNAAIVGTCETVEKPYFRLTSEANPSNIRPLSVLRKAFDLVQTKWKMNHDYKYVCDQLRSIRQDLTVQRIKEEFTIDVYEANARLAIQAGDYNELGQCQSQLEALYPLFPGHGHPTEFKAYRLLFSMFINNPRNLALINANLNSDEENDANVKFALALLREWSVCNYHRYFMLIEKAPPAMKVVLEKILYPQFRKKIMMVLMKGYKFDQKLPVSFVQKTLAFDSLEECRAFLSDYELEYADTSRSDIKCRESYKAVISK